MWTRLEQKERQWCCWFGFEVLIHCSSRSKELLYSLQVTNRTPAFSAGRSGYYSDSGDRRQQDESGIRSFKDSAGRGPCDPAGKNNGSKSPLCVRCFALALAWLCFYERTKSHWPKTIVWLLPCGTRCLSNVGRIGKTQHAHNFPTGNRNRRENRTKTPVESEGWKCLDHRCFLCFCFCFDLTCC